MLALPYQPDLIGENRWYLQDTTEDKWFIGSGIYLEDQGIHHWQKREALVSQVRGMDYFTIVGGSLQ